MRKGPHLVLYDRTCSRRIAGLDFGVALAGGTGRECACWLWNKKDFDDAPTATGIRISALAGSRWADDIIEGKWLGVRSFGVMDPSGRGIIDDNEDNYTPIGGGLLENGSFHTIGDIPSNCARRLFFRLILPQGYSPKGTPRLIVQAGFLSEPVLWLYAPE